MKKYVNSLGITCLEPKEGYLLRKNGQTFKSVMLGKNDRAELYEEVIDPDYIKNDSSDLLDDLLESNKQEELYILTSPSGKRFQLIVTDDGDLQLKEI